MYDSLAQLSLSNSAFLAKKNFKLHNWSVFESYFTATPCVDGGKISNNDVTMFAHGQVVSKVTLTRSKTSLRACLREGGGPQEGEVTCGKLPHLTCKCDHIKMRDFMDRRVTSPTWGPPPPSKQALSAKSLIWHLFLIFFFLARKILLLALLWKRGFNGPFARWRHSTTTTRILFVFPFIFKFGNPNEV